MKKYFNHFYSKPFFKYLILLLPMFLGSIALLHSNKPKAQLNTKKNNSKEILRLSDYADTLYSAYKLDSSYYYYNRAKILCDPKTNTTDYVYAVSCMSQIKYDQGDYVTSEANATEALPYLKYIKNPRYASILYNQLGINYRNTYNYNNAIFYFKKAIALKSSTWRKYMTLNNLAIIYMDQNKYKEAAQILLILSTLKRTSEYEETDKDNYALVIDNLGLCYYKLGDSKKALKYVNEALKIRLTLPSEYEYSLVGIYRHLCYFSIKTNPKLAKKYGIKALKVALKIKNLTDQTNALSLLIKSSEGNDLKKYSLSHIKLIDSIVFAGQKAKNQFSNMRYTSQMDKTENLQLKAQKAENDLELARQKSRNIILSIIILFILALLTFVYFHLTSRGNNEKKEAIYKSEIQLSKKLHDELANDIYQTLSFVKNTDLELDENKDQLLKNLDAIYSRTRDISKENSAIVTDEKYIIALKEMISGFKSSNINILLNGTETILWNEIEKSKKITVYRVLQELLVNMRKHSEATLIGINFKTTEKSIVVNYTDNGKGIDTSKMNLKNGLHNVENRILAIKGEIVIESSLSKGFKVFIKFPA